MKTFARHRTLDELRILCAEQGIEIDSRKHDDAGSDHVVLEGVIDNTPFKLLFSTFNGTFFGEAGGGAPFNESSDLDDEPWFSDLLDLLYVPKDAEAAIALAGMADIVHPDVPDMPAYEPDGPYFGPRHHLPMPRKTDHTEILAWLRGWLGPRMGCTAIPKGAAPMYAHRPLRGLGAPDFEALEAAIASRFGVTLILGGPSDTVAGVAEAIAAATRQGARGC